MEVFFEYIKEPDELAAACENLAGEKLLGFDTETTELDPFDGEIRLVQFSGGEKTIVIDLYPFREFGSLRDIAELDPLRELLASNSTEKIAHNAKFDAKWVLHHLNVELGGVFDSFLASVIIAAGERERRHNLADVSNFFLGIEVDKSEQVSDWNAEELSMSQIQYAAKDAALMIPLREKLVERLENDGLMNVAKLEFECVVPIAKMELNGIYLDTEMWAKQLEEIKSDQAKKAAELQELLAAGVSQASLFGVPEINLDSPTQINDALINLGVPVENSTSAGRLEPLQEEYPVVKKLLAYRKASKSVSSFGENILEFVNEETGRLHPDFRQIGAPTGRFSCSRPNVQQIPNQPEYRKCFHAPEGKKLVVADYSQIELRILADFSGDESFSKAFAEGADFHAAAASRIFGVDAVDVSSEQRSFAKRLNFGVVYGIGAQRFARMSGVTVRQAEDMLRRYFSTHNGLDEWLRNAANEAVDQGQARTGSGRLAKFRYENGDRAQIAAVKRNGKNLPIQGTSADILKRALRLMHDALKGTSGLIVNTVHDEVVVEVNVEEADEVADKVKAAMITAANEFVRKVPVVVDVAVTDEWLH